MAPHKLKSDLKEKDNFHEFYCVSCKVKRKKRADKNICIKTFTQKTGRITYYEYSSCDTCKTKVGKFISKAKYDELKADGIVECEKK